MKAILGILGATGVGKSNLAVKLAERFGTEIISADSMQVYKDMDIGTAKITAEQMQGIKHYMLDIVEPSCNFSAFDYATSVDDILTKKFCDKVPIICGGTGLYFDTLLYGLDFPSNEFTQAVRQDMERLLAEQGKEAVLEVLRQKDSVTYEKIDKNNLKRVIRAIEIASCGRSMYGEKHNREARYSNVLFALKRNREQMYNNIDKRVDQMIECGLVTEVEKLMNKYGDYLQNTAFQAIGYKEIISALSGDMTVEQAIEQIKLNTRHYAKRQITYYKRLGVIDVDLDSFATIDNACDYIYNMYLSNSTTK